MREVIRLKDFEGPLDLLLHLVSKYQMDIYEVPLTEVIEQYLAYVATVQAMRLELAGEYMVMASQLTLIKSRRLLPKIAEDTLVEDDPEQDLLQQLEEYRRFKLISEKVADQHAKRALYYSKPKTDLVYDDIELARDKTSLDVFLAFSRLMAEKQEHFRTSHTTIARDEYKIEDMMTIIRDRMAGQSDTALKLQDIFAETREKDEMISLFLAILELIKIQELVVAQEETFGEILLMKKEEENA
ncbi:segregation/condensation protein A [Streptococcus sp. DD13]|uniref:segregation/condensation protein A n=1 Tax=Streptococcus sp. DD13 TaxID=1777881 RepID=UPI00079A82E8|nr:segregation/condensation protein A [Streptococcus sp. DD13]KXT78233.1 Segregation and condensation protein A [Streptococcus sp. DD13]